jgi:hypothetical protein
MTAVFRNVHISFKDYATMNFRYLVRKQRLRLTLFPAIFLLIMVANIYSTSNLPASRQETGVGANWLYSAGIVVVFAWVAFSMRRTWRKQYDKTQFLQSPATFTFSDSGITIDSLTSQGAASWATIDTLLLMNELALLTTRNFTVHFLDFRYLEAPATKADFIALVQRHNIPVK